MAKFHLIGTLLLCSAFHAHSQKKVSDLLRQDLENVLIEDKLLLSEKIKAQASNEYWDNARKREKVVSQFQSFFDKIKNKLEPPSCTNAPLYNDVAIASQSLESLGSRVLVNGQLPPVINGTLPEYIIPENNNLGISLSSLNEDNSWFNFTSHSLLQIDAESKTKLEVGDKVNASIKAYLDNSETKAFQLSYACGTFDNYLGEVAERIIIQKTFKPYDWLIIRDFYEKSHLRKPTDSLIRSFAGVYLFSKQGTSSYKRLDAESLLKAGYNAGLVRTQLNAQVKRARTREMQSGSGSYKIYMMSRINAQAIPTPAQINQAVKSVVTTTLLSNEHTLNDKREERIKLRIGPIDSVVYAKLAVDEKFTLNNLNPAGILVKPVLIKDPVPFDTIGNYNLEIKLAINDEFRTNPISAVSKGENFMVPLRIYYSNITGNIDTLVFYESTTDVAIRYTNFPIINERHMFVLTDSTPTEFEFTGEIPVKLGVDDNLINSNGLILKYHNVPQAAIDSLRLGNLISHLAYGNGVVNPSNSGYTVKCKVPKSIIRDRTEDIILQYELNIRHSKQPGGSRRITEIRIPAMPML